MVLKINQTLIRNFRIRPVLSSVVLLIALTTVGCFSKTTVWHEPVIAPASAKVDIDLDPIVQNDTGAEVRQVVWEAAIDDRGSSIRPALPTIDCKLAIKIAERDYRIAVDQMESPTDEIVESFLQSTISAWTALQVTDPDKAPQSHTRLTDLYHSSLVEFVQFCEEYGRRDKELGIRIHGPEGDSWIPIQLNGFAWQPQDFDDLLTIGTKENEALGDHNCRPGWGVPLVGLRLDHRERFVARNIAFPVTCLLRPAVPGDSSFENQPGSQLVLELFEPRQVDSWTDCYDHTWNLAADFTAPMTWYLHHNSSSKLHGFRSPDTDESRLVLLEPYQPGKIPVILLHGLLSDPTTWLNTINELNRDPDFFERYQLLVFQYSTGKAFMSSAADFRREILTLYDQLWNEHQDTALNHTVLIGHSMGGLLSRFQVTNSNDRLWEALANEDLAKVRMGSSFRKNVQHIVFFRPVPYVERVVFIATPHNGSRIAKQFVGRLASFLVQRNYQAEYQQIMARNPGVFNKEYEDQLPTSTQLLIPDNPVLTALNAMETAPRVHLHSIIGTGKYMVGQGTADGVVPVSSARIPNVDSEILVDAKHNGIQYHPDTIAELSRILKLHWDTITDREELAGLPHDNHGILRK